MIHGDQLQRIHIEEAPSVWGTTPEELQKFFVAFQCSVCGKFYYMLKEDYERRLIGGGPSIDMSNIEERGITYFKEDDQWVLLYTIIS